MVAYADKIDFSAVLTPARYLLEMSMVLLAVSDPIFHYEWGKGKNKPSNNNQFLPKKHFNEKLYTV
jgi:hypothetical protein